MSATPRRPASRRLAALLAAALPSLTACHEPARDDVAPKAELITMFGLQRYLAPHGRPTPQFLPGGIPVRGRYQRPDPASPRITADVIPTFAGGQPGAYVTTEFWFNFDEVWVQPMYVLVTGRDPETGAWQTLPGAKPVFSVGADREPGQPVSAFYSPYWRIHYAQVPASTPADKYRSAAQILRDRLPLTPGPASLCALVPDDVDVTGYDRAMNLPPGHPTLGPFAGESFPTPVGPVARGRGWADGVEYSVLAFGTERFTWDEHLVVAERPLFVPVVRTRGGGLMPAGLPAIVGGRALHGGRGTSAEPGNKPNWGSLWRVYFAVMPPTIGTVLPLAQARAQDAPHPNAARILADAADLEASRVRVHDPMLPADAEPAVRPYYLRAALDAACFAQPGDFQTNCIWLDSQDAIERHIFPADIIDTGTLANCPFVTFAGKAVPL